MSKKEKKNAVKVNKVFNYCDNAYETLANADPHKKDPVTNVTDPSIESVVDTREFSEENKK